MDMRSQIMDASRRLFLERGYRGTSMREIAAACGIKVGNLNYYFRKKEDLLMLHHNNLMDSYCGRVFQRAVERVYRGGILLSARHRRVRGRAAAL